MTRVLLVPDLPLERWPSMDRYAHRLYDWLESGDPGFEVRLAAHIGELTRETKDGRAGGARQSGGYPRWWAQEVDPTALVLPGPLREPQRYVARYFFYPWWLRRDAKRARHLAGGRQAHQRGAVRGGPRVFLRSSGGADARPLRLAYPRVGVRGAARREHRRAQERAASDSNCGPAAQRSRRLPAAGGRALYRGPGAADRAARPAALRAQPAGRRRDPVAACLPRRRRAAVPIALRKLRLPGDRGVRLGAPGRDVGRGRAQGSGRRRQRGGRRARPHRIRAGARGAVGRPRAHGAADRARAGTRARVQLAEDCRADGGGVSEAPVTGTRGVCGSEGGREKNATACVCTTGCRDGLVRDKRRCHRRLG